MKYFHHYANNEVLIYIGSERIKSYVMLDFTSQYSWFSFANITNYQSASSYIINNNTQFTYYNEFYEGHHIQDSISFTDTLPIQLEYFIVSKTPYSVAYSLKGTLGFAYTFKNLNSSIVHQYKKAGLINEASFAVITYKDFYLGSLSEEHKVDKFHTYCDIIGINSSWNCALDQVIIRNGSKVIKYPVKNNVVTFTSDKEVNYVPKAFFDIMINDFYEVKKKNNYYRLSTIINKTHVYSQDDGESKHGKISFVINGYSYTVDINNFWDCYELACDLHLYANPYGDYWVLGHHFYFYYNTQFNYEDHRIHFYSKIGSGVEPFDHNQLDNNVLIQRSCLILSIIILVGGLITLGTVKRQVK